MCAASSPPNRTPPGRRIRRTRTAGPTPPRWWPTRTSCAVAVTPRRRRSRTRRPRPARPRSERPGSASPGTPPPPAPAPSRAAPRGPATLFDCGGKPARRVLLCQRPHTVHRHVDVKLLQAVGAEPGERVRGSMRSTRLRRRPDCFKKRRKVGLCLGPWQFGLPCLGVAAQRKEHQPAACAATAHRPAGVDADARGRARAGRSPHRCCHFRPTGCQTVYHAPRR
jgi:hypothetical protein